MARTNDSPCESFEQRLIAAQGPLSRALGKRGVSKDRAADLAQEATLRALRARASYETGRDILPWLLLIAWRVELDERRRRKTPGGVRAQGGDRKDLDRTDTSAGPAGDEVAMREARSRVERAVSDLAGVRRQIVDLFYRDGLRIAEIAERLGVAEGTVKSHLHRAREEIAARLARRDDR